MAATCQAGHGGGGGGGAGGNGGIVILCTSLETKKGIMADGKVVVTVSKGTKGTKGTGGSTWTSGNGYDASTAVDGKYIEIIM